MDAESLPSIEVKSSDDWAPYNSRIAFETAEFLYKRCKMSASNIDTLLQLWAATLVQHGDTPPFSNHEDVYSTIDATPIGGVPWQSLAFSHNGARPEIVPKWMEHEYTTWFRDPHLLLKNMLQNPEFADSFDYSPLRQYDANGERYYDNFMTGNWAWKEAVSSFFLTRFYGLICTYWQDTISQDPKTHGAMFVPVVLGSDKTTVSVATGHTEYWPLYASIGNIHNNIRRAHGSGLVLVGFLPIPKGSSSFLAHFF